MAVPLLAVGFSSEELIGGEKITQRRRGRKGWRSLSWATLSEMTPGTDWRSMLRRYNGEGAQPKMAVLQRARAGALDPELKTYNLRLKTNN